MTTFPPIVDRELRLRARQGVTYWARCGLAAIAGLVAAQSIQLYAGVLNPAAVGPRTFAALSWLCFLSACLSALATADCLSGERREGTLGLLFLTRLKGRQVLFGKLTAAGMSALYGLVGFLPALALALIAGGVGGGELARTSLALLNALFVSLAAGMWISAAAQSQLQAMRRTLVLVAIMFVWSWVAGHMSPLTSKAPMPMAIVSPYGAFLLAPDAAYTAAPWRFWAALVFEHNLGWVMLVAANARLNRRWGEAQRAQASRAAPLKQPIRFTPKVMTEEDRLLQESEPICWVVSRTQGHNLYVWAGALILLLGGAGAPLFGGGAWLAVNLCSSLAAGGLLAWGAGRSLFTARRSGELELLLSTPLGARDIVRGHWWALWRPMRGAWLLAVFLLVLQFISLPGLDLHQHDPFRGMRIGYAALTPLNKVLDAVALCWVGMLFGLRARRAIQVVLWTVGAVILLPWFIMSVFSFLIPGASGASWGHAAGLDYWAVAYGTGGPGVHWGPWIAAHSFMAGPIFYLAKNIFLIWWAVHSLRKELRATAPLAASDWLK